jgi:hypothetical protein
MIARGVVYQSWALKSPSKGFVGTDRPKVQRWGRFLRQGSEQAILMHRAAAVLKLTGSAGIQLNERVLLQCHATPLWFRRRAELAARPHIYGFQLRHRGRWHSSTGARPLLLSRGLRMVWFLTLPLICAAAAIFIWRFEKHLEELTGPWLWRQ